MQEYQRRPLAGRLKKNKDKRTKNPSFIETLKRRRSGSSLKIEMSMGRPKGKPYPESESWPATPTVDAPSVSSRGRNELT